MQTFHFLENYIFEGDVDKTGSLLDTINNKPLCVADIEHLKQCVYESLASARMALFNTVTYLLIEAKNTHSNRITSEFKDWFLPKIRNLGLVAKLWENYKYLADQAGPPKFLKQNIQLYYLNTVKEQYKLVETLYIIFLHNVAECTGP